MNIGEQFNKHNERNKNKMSDIFNPRWLAIDS